MKSIKFIYYITSIFFLLGAAGIFISSYDSTYRYSKVIFIVSSLFLGISPLFLVNNEILKQKNDFFIVTLLFFITIIKVIGLHLKYGMYLGCDSAAEFHLINHLFFSPHFDLFSDSLTEFPLSYISVFIFSQIIDLNHIILSWNLIHLITSSLTVVYLYLLIKNIFDRNVAIVSSFAYMYNPAVSIYSLSMTRENFGVLFLVASLYVILIQFNKNRPLKVFLYVVFSISLILSHYTSAYFSLLIMGLLFFIGLIMSISKNGFMKNYPYKKFHLLFFTVFLFYWVFLITFHHQNDILVADNMLKGILNFLSQLNDFDVASHRETAAIINDFSIVQLLYKIQAFYIALGSFLLLYHVRKLSREQSIFAITAFVCMIILLLSAFVPSLADSLSPTRIMRYGIIISCISVGYISTQTNLIAESFNLKKYKIIIIIPILLITLFVFPISQWIATEYMAFNNEPYPYQLRSEMYNIKSIHEFDTLSQINSKLPKNSTLEIETPLAVLTEYILSESPNLAVVPLNESYLFNNTSNYDQKISDFVFMRRSLFENRQYIWIPTNWISTSSFKRDINDTEFLLLNEKIASNYLLYNEGSYKLLKFK